MREILFHGKRIDNGEWVESSVISEKDGKPFFFVHWMDGIWLRIAWVEVDRNTICAYTGHQDANGRKIFEKDILHNCKNPYWVGVVMWRAETEEFQVTVGIPRSEKLPEPCDYEPQEWVVVGNIHDNPELLEVN